MIEYYNKNTKFLMNVQNLEVSMNINYIKKIAIECIENNRIESDFWNIKNLQIKKIKY